jgi:hypothetical protein
MRATTLALSLAVLAAGCGGGMPAILNPNPQPTPASKVSSVVPRCATPLASGASEPCTVVVMGTGSFNTAVNWSTSSGTISSSGVLTAPTVTAAASITVTATSVQDSVSGVAVVSVTAPAPPPPTITSVTVACPSPIQTGQTSACTANVQGQGSFNPAVTWSASDGTVSTSGVFTAPQKVETVIVTATSVQDSKFFGTASVVVQAAPPPAVASVSVSCISPVNSGATSQCSGTVSPAGAPQTLSWSASGGSIAQTGLLTAPTVTTNTNVVVTATSTADSTKSGMFTVAVTAAAPPPPPSGPQNLGLGQSPVMRLDSNGVIDIAWLTMSGVSFTRSLNNGATFSPVIQVAPTPGYADNFDMQLDAANNIVIFAGYIPAGIPVGIIARSTDGKTFTVNSEPSMGNFVQLLVEPSGAIDIAWLDYLNLSLHEVRSTDGGASFSKDLTIWTAVKDAGSLAVAGGPQGQIYIFWDAETGLQCDILFVNSLDGAKTFSAPLQLSTATGCNASPFPLVDAAGNLNVAWLTSGNALSFTRSTDQGQTFSPVSQPVQNGIEVNSQRFAVGPNGEIDMVYGAAAIGDNFDVFFTRSTDHGATFSTPVKLNLPTVQNFTGGGDASVAVDVSGKISVAWEDDSNGMFSGDADIYLRSSTDGVTFSAATNLSNTTDQSEVSPIVIIGPKLIRYLTWYDNENLLNKTQTISVFFDVVP